MRSIDEDGDGSVDINEFFMHFGHQRSDVLATSAIVGAAVSEGGGSTQGNSPSPSQGNIGPFAVIDDGPFEINEEPTAAEPISVINGGACCGKLV